MKRYLLNKRPTPPSPQTTTRTKRRRQTTPADPDLDDPIQPDDAADELLRTAAGSPQSVSPDAHWQDHLRRRGWAVVPDVISPQQCQAMIDGFWEWTRRTCGAAPDRPESWRSIHNLYPKHGMLLQHWAVGHMQAIWDLRDNDNVIRVFQKIHHCRDLTVSFDGASISLPPEVTRRGWHRQDWLHIDQSLRRSGFECVQGWVTPLEVGPGDATLSLLEGSHLLHADFARHVAGPDKTPAAACSPKDWHMLSDPDLRWFRDRGCRRVDVRCPAGAMVLWDSRTVHSGRAPLRNRPKPNPRMVAYISMMPRRLLTPAEKKKKRKALLEGRTTNHWAATRVRLFPKLPRTYNNPLPDVPPYAPPLLSLRAARMAGWDAPKRCPLTIPDRAKREAAVAAALRPYAPLKLSPAAPTIPDLATSPQRTDFTQ